jgi:hypothetical protein
MQFRARLAAVSGTAPRSDRSKPNVISVKLEPMELLEAEWLFERLGEDVVVDLMDAPPERTPMDEAIDRALAR